MDNCHPDIFHVTCINDNNPVLVRVRNHIWHRLRSKIILEAYKLNIIRKQCLIRTIKTSKTLAYVCDTSVLKSLGGHRFEEFCTSHKLLLILSVSIIS